MVAAARSKTSQIVILVLVVSGIVALMAFWNSLGLRFLRNSSTPSYRSESTAKQATDTASASKASTNVGDRKWIEVQRYLSIEPRPLYSHALAENVHKAQ